MSVIKNSQSIWYPQSIHHVSNGGLKSSTVAIKQKEEEDRSDLTYLDPSVYDYNPILLFRSWYNEALQGGLLQPNAGCLATASRDGQQVTARHLLLRRLDEDNGFVILTDKRSVKGKHLAENPNASMSFLWCYRRDDGAEVNRQVRVEGTVKQLGRSETIDVYDRQPLYCKVRAHVCHQGQIIDDWNELKSEHDSLYNAAKQGKQLSVPDYYAAYKLEPKVIEFYDTVAYQIADRALFLVKEDGTWSYQRIAA